MTQPTASARSKATRHRRPRSAGRPDLLPSELHAARGKPSLSRRLRYAFDNAISRQPHIVMLWLGLLTLGVVLLVTLVVSVGGISGVNGDEQDTWAEAFWQTLLRILDTGTVAADVGWPARLIGILVTVAGIFLAGSLIGLITNLLDQKLLDLRKGTSLVLERDHTLVLGWSPRVPTIVEQLVLANSSRRKATVVVVASEDKTAMEDTLRSTVPRTGATTIVCRSGQPWTGDALAMGNVGSARSVIVTGGEGDAETVKTLLAIHTSPDPNPPHVVAEIDDEGLARSLERIIGPSLSAVCSDVMVAELAAQACRQRGVAAVLDELLDFQGAEFYFADATALAGRSFGEACLAYPRAAVVGLRSAGRVRLNPNHATVIPPEAEVVVVCEDDSLVTLGPVTRPAPGGTERLVGDRPHARPRRVAVLGWSRLAPRVISEMDEFMAPDTVLDVIIDPALVERSAIDSVVTYNTTLSVVELSGAPEVLADYVHRSDYDQVIVLGARDALSVDEADARTLLTVLALHTHPEQINDGLRIVVELLDQRHTSLARATGADDFVVSDQLTSRMLSQLSENAGLAPIFDELFRPEGTSVQIRPLTPAAAGATFKEVVADGLAQGFTPIGLVDIVTGRVRLAPDKSGPLTLSPDEHAVVIAGGT